MRSIFCMVDNKHLIRKILEDKEYVVKVSYSSNESNVVTLETPERKLKPKVMGVYVLYGFGEINERGTGILYKSDIYNDFIKCPIYCIKSFIKADIDKICDVIMYDKSMISYTLDNKRVDENDFYPAAFPYKHSEEELEKIEILESMLQEPEELVNGNNKEILNSKHYEEVMQHIKNFFFTEE